MDKLTRLLHELEFYQCKIKDLEICYRGVSDCSWEDSPSLFRKNLFDKEVDLMESVIRMCPDDFRHANTIDILTQMQHYGCPTRLLDVTTNFLVALFFACSGWERVVDPHAYEDGLKHKDGLIRIYGIKPEKVKSINSETVTLLANLAWFESHKRYGEIGWLCKKDIGVWEAEYLEDNFKDVSDNVILVKSKLSNPRMRAQYGEFFLFGGLKNECCYSFHCKNNTDRKVIKQACKIPSNYLIHTITVPHNQKEEMLEICRSILA